MGFYPALLQIKSDVVLKSRLSMPSNLLTINPQMKVRQLQVGQEKTVVIIIDDFSLDLDKIKNHACTEAVFAQDKNSFYPGIRAPLPRDYVITMLQAIYRPLYNIYNIPTQKQLKPQDTFYSLVTTPENELSLPQRLPHFDTSRPLYFAATHYIKASNHGGTGIFRHKQTGYERINESRVSRYLKKLNNHIDNEGASDNYYITQSNEQFELIETIDYKENRLVIYPGSLLHSALIIPQFDIDSSPETGRLTTNTFFEFI